MGRRAQHSPLSDRRQQAEFSTFPGCWMLVTVNDQDKNVTLSQAIPVDNWLKYYYTTRIKCNRSEAGGSMWIIILIICSKELCEVSSAHIAEL